MLKDDEICTHQDTTWEFVYCAEYEEAWMCQGCGEIVSRYVECL